MNLEDYERAEIEAWLDAKSRAQEDAVDRGTVKDGLRSLLEFWDFHHGKVQEGALAADELACLAEDPPRKISCIRLIRDRLGLNLRDSKAYMDHWLAKQQ